MTEDDGKIRVLLADDEPDIRVLLRRMLELDGRFAIVGDAKDGREAVDMSVELKPDVVVLDLAMPVMDGLEAIPEITRQAPETKIVVLSAFGASEMYAQALSAGASIYLEKGEAVRALVDTLISVTS
ncbi:MAG: response regulator transcription factor [Acidimicrobiia bacterium]